MNSAFSIWLSAIRPKTLPLASAAIFLASAIAAYEGVFNGAIFFLALLTAVLLQIISNLANDYGDAVTGADDENRIGPTRVMQAGLVSKKMMQQALVIAIIAAISCGALLLYISVADNLLLLSLYLVLGGLAVVAAITYTMGASPYGYSGLGDLAVFVFFGLAAVVGGNVLFSHQFQPLILLPATFCGLLCVLVLNVNNLRDLTNDKRIGKNTLAVRLGHKNTIRYHVLLLVVAQSCAVIYIIVAQLPPLTWLHLLALPLLIKSTAKLVHFNNGEIMNQQLKMTVMSTFLYCSLFSLGFIV